MAIKQLSIFVENKPGALAEVTHALGEAQIDIRALSIADTQSFGILRLIVSGPEAARDRLASLGYVVTITEVVAVAVSDKPGALIDVMHLLGEEGINVEYMYAFLAGTEGTAYVVLRVADNDRAAALLSAAGVTLIDGDTIKEL